MSIETFTTGISILLVAMVFAILFFGSEKRRPRSDTFVSRLFATLLFLAGASLIGIMVILSNVIL